MSKDLPREPKSKVQLDADQIDRALAVMCLIAALVLAVALFVIVSGIAPQRPLDAQRIVHDYSKDPKLGSVPELPVTDAFGRAIPPPPPAGRLLVAAGSCSECNPRSVRPSQIVGGDFSDVVFLVEVARPEEVPRGFAKLGNVYIVADVGRRYTNALNATWTPRFYLLGGRGQLVEIQIDPLIHPTWVRLSQNRDRTGDVR